MENRFYMTNNSIQSPSLYIKGFIADKIIFDAINKLSMWPGLNIVWHAKQKTNKL